VNLIPLSEPERDPQNKSSNDAAISYGFISDCAYEKRNRLEISGEKGNSAIDHFQQNKNANNAIHRMATRVTPPAWARSSPGRSRATGSHR
jgi:hypothetical protein